MYQTFYKDFGSHPLDRRPAPFLSFNHSIGLQSIANFRSNPTPHSSPLRFMRVLYFLYCSVLKDVKVKPNPKQNKQNVGVREMTQGCRDSQRDLLKEG